MSFDVFLVLFGIPFKFKLFHMYIVLIRFWDVKTDNKRPYPITLRLLCVGVTSLFLAVSPLTSLFILVYPTTILTSQSVIAIQGGI